MDHKKIKHHLELKHSYFDKFRELDQLHSKVVNLTDQASTGANQNWMQAAFNENLFETLSTKESKKLKAIKKSVIDKFLKGE